MILYATTGGATEYYKYLINAQSLIGPTGNIATPSPYTTPKNSISFGLHRFLIGLNYGISTRWEMGVNFNMRKISSLEETYSEAAKAEGEHTAIVHTKYNFTGNRLNNESLNISGGFYLNTFFEENSETLSYQDVFYVAAGQEISSKSNTLVQVGADLASNSASFFLTFVQPTRFSLFLCEYKSRSNEMNFGWRVLLSPDVKFDIFARSTGNLRDWFSTLVFGLTIATSALS